MYSEILNDLKLAFVYVLKFLDKTQSYYRVIANIIQPHIYILLEEFEFF